ncbi:MAG: cell division protein FtsQ/DivIB [Christensenellales bacterium]
MRIKKDKRDLYNFEVEEEKEKKKKRKKNKKIDDTKKVRKINPDNEIIIGVTRYPSPEEKNKKSSKKTKDKRPKKVTSKKKEISEYTENKPEKKTGIIGKILKWTSLFLVFIAMIVFATVSPIFNITEVDVTGNKRLSKEQVVDLSGIETDENIFKENLSSSKKSIKQSGYIENVNIKRILPNKVEINIVEREATFASKFGNGYIYLNNQGYILEINEKNDNLPELVGLSTSGESVAEGNRLNNTDLKKLSVVLKIMSTANVKNIFSLINRIDVTDESNYKLYFDSEQKVAYLGDCSDLETRMLYLASILEKEKGNPGEIFVNINLNTDDAFFRESVQR